MYLYFPDTPLKQTTEHLELQGYETELSELVADLICNDFFASNVVELIQNTH